MHVQLLSTQWYWILLFVVRVRCHSFGFVISKMYTLFTQLTFSMHSMHRCTVHLCTIIIWRIEANNAFAVFLYFLVVSPLLIAWKSSSAFFLLFFFLVHKFNLLVKPIELKQWRAKKSDCASSVWQRTNTWKYARNHYLW